MFADAEAVVNLLTHIPSADRMALPGAWEENDRLRGEASAVIARAAQAAGARRLVQESLAFVYADGGDCWLDEASPVAGGGTIATALAAKTNARELFRGEPSSCASGSSSAPTAGSRRRTSMELGTLAPLRASAVVTHTGRRWIDDAAAAVAAALDAPAGTYNVVDADPPQRGEIDAVLAEVVGRRPPSPDRGDPGRARARGALPARVEPATARGDGLDAPRARGHGGLAPHRGRGRGSVTAAQRFARARPRLLRLAYSELGDLGEAEDVVQEAWLRLERTGAEAIDDLTPGSPPSSAGSPSTRCDPHARAARPTSDRGCRSRSCPAALTTRPTGSRSTSRSATRCSPSSSSSRPQSARRSCSTTSSTCRSARWRRRSAAARRR